MPGSVGGGSLVEDFSQSHQLCHSDLLQSTHILEPIPGHTIMRNIVQRIQSVILMLLGGGNTVLSCSLVLKLLRSSSLCFQVFCPATLNRVKILTEVYLTDSALFPPTFQKKNLPQETLPRKKLLNRASHIKSVIQKLFTEICTSALHAPPTTWRTGTVPVPTQKCGFSSFRALLVCAF